MIARNLPVCAGRGKGQCLLRAAIQPIIPAARTTDRSPNIPTWGRADYKGRWHYQRFAIATDAWPTIRGIFNRLNALPAFRDAAPDAQPDAI